MSTTAAIRSPSTKDDRRSSNIDLCASTAAPSMGTADPQTHATAPSMGTANPQTHTANPSMGTANPQTHTADPLAGIPRPHGRDLSGAELRDFVSRLAEQPELWIDLVTHDPARRHFEELLCDAHLSVWLICWMDDHDTGFHDHDLSAGAVAVVSGRVREERLVLGGPPRDRLFAVGEAFHFSAADIHRVRHAGSDPAVTLHAYSPPLTRMGAYYVDGDGVLARQSLSQDQELRPSNAGGR
jgi:predicted metal-dependent enzyme (double-stranded beta helix superfamily)